MPFNGLQMTPDASRIAKDIQRRTGLSYLGPEFSIVGNGVQGALRQLYSATGGNRSAASIAAGSGYNPTNSELKAIYNGEFTGAELMASKVGKPLAPKMATPSPSETPMIIEEAAGSPEALAKIIAAAMGNGQKLNPEAVKAMANEAVSAKVGEILSSLGGLVAEEVAKQVRTIEIKVAGAPPVKVDRAHKMLPEMLLWLANGQNVMIVGPAGSGKTSAAAQAAKLLEKDFYFTGKVADETKLLGYMDANGRYNRTAFRDAYEKGGIFLFDEMDGSAPDAIIAFNAPLDGDFGDFPDGRVAKHEDFVAIAATNTYGLGADRVYVGREQLDGASLDRFAVIEWDYDEELELAISANAEWTKYVQKVRKAVMGEKLRHIVSPRASIKGGIMLAAGLPRTRCEESLIWKGMPQDQRNRVKAAMR